MAKDAFESVTDLDSRLYRTLGQLFRRPGALTVAYATGKRKPYLGPVQLFLLANVMYFFLQAFSSYTGYNTPLASHLDHQIYSDALPLQTWVDNRAAASELSADTYAAVFDQQSEVLARTLVFAMVPIFALFIGALTIGSGRFAADHITFALHYFAFELIAVHCVFLMVWPRLLIAIGTVLVGAPSASTHSTVWPIVQWLIEFGAHAFITLPYLLLAIRRVYGVSVIRAALVAFVATLSLFVTIVAYRLLLFFSALTSVN